jgi:hypothetical protein
MKILKNLHQVLFEAFSTSKQIQQGVGIYTAIPCGAYPPYIILPHVKTKRVSWNNDNSVMCNFSIVMYADAYDNLTCLETLGAIEKVLQSKYFLHIAESHNLAIANMQILQTDISQNEKNLFWEGVLDAILYAQIYK